MPNMTTNILVTRVLDLVTSSPCGTPGMPKDLQLSGKGFPQGFLLSDLAFTCGSLTCASIFS